MMSVFLKKKVEGLGESQREVDPSAAANRK